MTNVTSGQKNNLKFSIAFLLSYKHNPKKKKKKKLKDTTSFTILSSQNDMTINVISRIQLSH